MIDLTQYGECNCSYHRQGKNTLLAVQYIQVNYGPCLILYMIMAMCTFTIEMYIMINNLRAHTKQYGHSRTYRLCLRWPRHICAHICIWYTAERREEQKIINRYLNYKYFSFLSPSYVYINWERFFVIYRISMTIALVIFAVFLSAFQVNGYPNGAPKKVCTGPMIPHHHHLDPQPPDTSPITKFNTVWNSDNETVSSNEL